MAVPEETPGYHPTPESSPELTKRSWFVILIIIIVIIVMIVAVIVMIIILILI